MIITAVTNKPVIKMNEIMKPGSELVWKIKIQAALPPMLAAKR